MQHGSVAEWHGSRFFNQFTIVHPETDLLNLILAGGLAVIFDPYPDTLDVDVPRCRMVYDMFLLRTFGPIGSL